MENSDLLIKSEKFKEIEVFVMKGKLAYLTIGGEPIDNPAYVWEILKALKIAYDKGAFSEFDDELYNETVTPTIYV
jgi:hypothetical protein